MAGRLYAFSRQAQSRTHGCHRMPSATPVEAKGDCSGWEHNPVGMRFKREDQFYSTGGVLIVLAGVFGFGLGDANISHLDIDDLGDIG